MTSLSYALNSLRLNSPLRAVRSGGLRRFQPGGLRWAMSTVARPALRKQNEDGSEEEIEEEELFRFTRHRWLCNDRENLAARYRKFNTSALLDAAVNAAGDGATSCVKLLKCLEGQHNKAFIMTMDNGVEVFAKIPNPNAGPAFYTTASEVATRHFLRTALNVPVPRVYAHSSDPLNPVGAEYVIEENAEGKPLGALWFDLEPKVQFDLMAQLVDLETKLTSVSFRGHGCIYYKKDLDKKGDLAYDLEVSSGDLAESLTEEFVLGPLTEAKLWEGYRATMDLDRGPWSDPLSYLTAMGTNEIKWAKAYAMPHVNPFQSLEALEFPEEFISLVERYLQLVPRLAPGPSQTWLSHPALHLDNIFVDPDTNQITSIIDWQSASVSEPHFQHNSPLLYLQGAGKAKKINTDPFDHYLRLTELENAPRWAALNVHNRSLFFKLLSSLCGAWSRNDMFAFREALIDATTQWEEIAPATGPCPVQFTMEELKRHSSEVDLVDDVAGLLHPLQNVFLISQQGMVFREDYEKALRVNKVVKKLFVNMAESESQKALYSRMWPWQDQDL